jgi:hypothetical protein
MKKTLILGLALALVGGVAYANFCARDVVPASSLLLPYAVVDLNADGSPDVNGYTTLFAVTNVSSTHELVHFTVWSAESNPVVDWDELFTGYDVWTINFRDLLTGHFDFFDTGIARLHPTPAGGPPPYGPTTNQAGIVSNLALADDPAVPFANCNFPYGYHPNYGTAIVTNLQNDINAQTTQDVSGCKPSGTAISSPPWLTGLGASPVFFYVTADVVGACNQAFPDETGYWTGNAGGKYPIDRNVIIGDVIWVNSSLNYSESMPAVHLEADPAAAHVGFNAFYNRYTPAGVYDDREPLGTAFAFRYINTYAASQVIVWKDHSEADDPHVHTTQACLPYAYYAWDEQENAIARGGGGPSGFNTAEPNALPFETQSAPLNQANFDGLSAVNGWVMLVFDPSIPANQETATVTQAWVAVRYLAGGYSTATEAAVLANTNCFTNQILPQLGINVNPNVGATFPQTSVYLP